MQEFIVLVMNRFGYWGMGLLIAVENIFPPIPSEVILTFGGFMTTYTKLSVVGVVISATGGSVAGALILYGIGLLLTPQKLEGLLESRTCRLLGFKSGDIMNAVGWFQGHGNGAVFLGRCIPIIRSLISIPAGMSKMNLPVFLALTTAGSLVWNTVLVGLGSLAGASWKVILHYMDFYSSAIMIVIGAGLILVIFLFFQKRMIKK